MDFDRILKQFIIQEKKITTESHNLEINLGVWQNPEISHNTGNNNLKAATINPSYSLVELQNREGSAHTYLMLMSMRPPWMQR
jgi:hypothetical protein